MQACIILLYKHTWMYIYRINVTTILNYLWNMLGNYQL